MQKKRSHGFRELIDDFGLWSSAKGPAHVPLTSAIWLKLFWFVIAVATTAGFLYMLIFELLKTYFSYPVNVDTQNNYGPRPFPAVTFCFLNPWKITQISGTPLEDLVYAYLDNQDNAQYGFTLPVTTRWNQRAEKWTNFMYEELMAMDASKNMSYSYNDFFISCTYNQNNCYESDFDEFYDPMYGRCYTFNKNLKYNSTWASPNYGLQVILRINLIQFLPWTTSAGVKVYIHNKDQSSLVNNFGYFLPVAKSSSLGIRALYREKLPKPYSTCINKNPKQTMYYPGDYDLELCLRSCVQDKIIAKCGCYDPTYAWPNDTMVNSCYSSDNSTDSNQAIDCIWSITNIDGSSGNPYADCGCPQQCSDQTYRVTMSNAFWPMQKYKPTECIIDAYAPNKSTGYDIWNQPVPTNLPTLNRGVTTPPTAPSTQKPKHTRYPPTTAAARGFCTCCWWCNPCPCTSTSPPTSPSNPHTPPSHPTPPPPPSKKPASTPPTNTPSTTDNGNENGKRKKRAVSEATTTQTPTTSSSSVPNLAPCTNWYDVNTLLAEVYYERLDYETRAESPAYTVIMLISDIGGQMGFWLGMSIISVIEIILFLLVFVCYAIAPQLVSPNLDSLGFKAHDIRPHGNLDHKNSDLNLYNENDMDHSFPTPYVPPVSNSGYPSDFDRPNTADSQINFDWETKKYLAQMKKNNS